jgi:hypothetical protein
VKKKLKLTKLTVTNLNRVKGGDGPVCVCQVFPGGGTDQACNETNGPSIRPKP